MGQDDRLGPKRILTPYAAYTYHRFDGSLGDVAARYQTTVGDIMRTTLEHLPGLYREVHTEQEFSRKVHEGSVLALPVPPAEMELWWEKKRGAGTLQALCDRVNAEKARTFEPRLTPLSLLGYLRNAEMRSKLLAKRARSAKDLHAHEADLGLIPLPEGAVIAVPYNPALLFRPVSATPHDAVKRSTVTTQPEWGVLHDTWLVPLEAASKRLEDVLTRCQEHRLEAMREIGTLRLLQWFLEQTDVERDPSFKDDHDALLRQLSKLQGAALATMVQDPDGVAETPDASEREDAFEDLLELVLATRVAKLVEKAFVEEDRPVHRESGKWGCIPLAVVLEQRPTLKWLIVWDLQRAILLLSLVNPRPESLAWALFVAELDAAIKGMATAKEKSLPGATPLQKILSVIGADSEVVSDLFRTLSPPKFEPAPVDAFGEPLTREPGALLTTPYCLSLSTTMIRSAIELQRVSRRGASPGSGREIAETLKTALVRSTNLHGPDAAAFEDALSNRFGGGPAILGSGLSQWAQRIDGTLRTVDPMAKSLGHWQGILPTLRITAICVTLAGEDSPLQKTAGVVDHLASSAKGIYEQLEVLGSDSSVIKGLGAVASLAGIVTGFATVVDGADRGDPCLIIAGGIQVAGSIAGGLGLLVTAWEWLTPWGAAASLFSWLISLGAGTSRKELFSQTLKRFGEPGDGIKTWFARVSKNVHDVSDALKDFEECITDSGSFPPLKSTQEVCDRLTSMRFSYTTICSLMNRPEPFVRPMYRRSYMGGR